MFTYHMMPSHAMPHAPPFPHHNSGYLHLHYNMLSLAPLFYAMPPHCQKREGMDDTSSLSWPKVSTRTAFIRHYHLFRLSISFLHLDLVDRCLYGMFFVPQMCIISCVFEYLSSLQSSFFMISL